MKHEILYIKNIEKFGYRKIVAIKDVNFPWGNAELETANFGILTVEISDENILAWSNQNKYCLNTAETKIIETPAEYQIKMKDEIIIEGGA